MSSEIRCCALSVCVSSFTNSTAYSLCHLPTARPTPFDRQRAAAERRAQANMPNFGPKTQLETVEEELSEARKRIAHLEEANASLRGNLDVLKSQVFRYENIKEDRRQLLFLTGLTPEMRFALWSFIKPSRENIISAKSAASEARGRVNTAGAGRKSVLSLEDELLMTLMRLRLARQEQDLAYQFGVSCSSVSRITLMWTNFLYLRLGLIPIWPKWEDIERTMPVAFKETYPTTFAVIDATELKVEVPSS